MPFATPTVTFVVEFEAKYPKATACLVEDQEALLAFFAFPAEHWRHLRTSNLIESPFATVRLRLAGAFCYKSAIVQQ